MKNFRKFIGFESNTTSHAEKWVSGIGGVSGILFTFLICQRILGADEYLVITSMGASAVLLFALPHVTVTQPWSLVTGQVVSAIVGVTCARYIPDVTIAASVAVGGSILVMYYFGSVHPPGGASALAAVVGGPKLHALGYLYVLEPVLLNSIVLMILAIVVNYPFKWRRYPVHLSKLLEDKLEPTKGVDESVSMFTSEDLQLAMKQLDLYFDVSEEDLTRLVNLAVINYKKAHLLPSEIRLGRYYANGRSEDELEIRHVVDESLHDDVSRDMVIYKVMNSGTSATGSAVVPRVQFAKWARYEVRREQESWERVDH